MGLPIPPCWFTSRSIVTNGTGRPVPYKLDFSARKNEHTKNLKIFVGNGLDRSAYHDTVGGKTVSEVPRAAFAAGA